MNEGQFSELMGKLEEIRCGITVHEEPQKVERYAEEVVSANQIRLMMHDRLDKKTGWGRNEVKAVLDEVIAECL